MDRILSHRDRKILAHFDPFADATAAAAMAALSFFKRTTAFMRRMSLWSQIRVNLD
jgi:hypothetical protein